MTNGIDDLRNRSQKLLNIAIFLVFLDAVIWLCLVGKLKPLFADFYQSVPFLTKIIFSKKFIFVGTLITVILLVIKEILRNKKVTFMINLAAIIILVIAGIFFVFGLVQPVFINRI